MNAAELIIKMLEQEGVEYIFGVPGGAIEDLNTALYNSKKIKPIVTKNEIGAAYMADGFARVSGRLSRSLPAYCTNPSTPSTNWAWL